MPGDVIHFLWDLSAQAGVAEAAVEILRSIYVSFAYDPQSNERFMSTMRGFDEALAESAVHVSTVSEAAAEYRIYLDRFGLPPDSPRGMLISALRQNYRYMSDEIGNFAREADRGRGLFSGSGLVFRDAQTNAAFIQETALRSVPDYDEELDLSIVAQGWNGQSNIHSLMVWAFFMSLMERGQDVLIPQPLSRLIRGAANSVGLAEWEQYIDDTLAQTGFEFDASLGEERSDAVTAWLNDFSGNIDWESTGHQAVRNSLYALVASGRTDIVRAYFELERMGLGSRVREAIHLAVRNGNDDLLLSIFELVRKDAQASLGYEMQEFLDVSIALLSATGLSQGMLQNLIEINQKLIDVSAMEDEWLREPEGLEFLTGLYQKILMRYLQLEREGVRSPDAIRTAIDTSVEGRLLKIAASSNINEIRVRLVKDVLSLSEADQATNSRAFAALENRAADFQQMLDIADPAEFPFRQHTGLRSRRSLPPGGTNGASGANGGGTERTQGAPPGSRASGSTWDSVASIGFINWSSAVEMECVDGEMPSYDAPVVTDEQYGINAQGAAGVYAVPVVPQNVRASRGFVEAVAR